ncbi:ATP-binding protein [Vulcaniibacterium tengchongense]|uniref:histidine kinase n=1 Tax=Vulcaniibacterium tengchongense TaxID=1273429 RepID=A0A3N4VEZ5_9GAMM|nr:ATP-binding protein [Vulcaniibacterium tengchongense]RPE81552.1 two-component system sensor histidine kinase RegB [Vulcaniibacterium tengchongense]
MQDPMPPRPLGEAALSMLPMRSRLGPLHPLIQLRWIAVVGQVATILFVHYGFGIALPLVPMTAVVAALAAFNLASMLRWRRREDVGEGALFAALLVDVLTLTALLHFSGGISNPFVFLYLLQVALAAVLLRARTSLAVAAVASACIVALTLWRSPVAIPIDPSGGLRDPYVQGLLVCFGLNAILLVMFISRISASLRARDARLAALRQRAAEEEHIVRMGLLASGAAHELGTPLATLSVILGDWRRMQPFVDRADLRQELDEMQAQVDRCKSIVTGILLSAGETRGEAPAPTTLSAFLDGVVAEWRATRPVLAFEYAKHFDGDLHIVSDTGLKQMIQNVLDNALEASPGWVGLDAAIEDEALVLRVRDRGPGFAPQMLANLGKPYQSSKGRPGRGLGLFLAVNVARTLGGSIAARNAEPRGAVVTVTLPLSALTLEEEDLDEGGRDEP